MRKLRVLAASILSALAVNAYSQKLPPIPKIPDFEVKYETEVHKWLVSSSGPVYWRAKTFKTDDKPSREITEIKGQVDIDVKFAFFAPTNHYLGFITRIDRANRTIESVIYGTSEKDTLTLYDKLLAAKDSIDINKASSIDHRLIDYKNRRVFNLELLADSVAKCDSSADTELQDNAVGFNEGYFIIPKTIGTDSMLTANYRGETFFVQTQTKEDDDMPMIYIDLTKPDPLHPGKRVNIIEDINWLKIYVAPDGIPEIVKAEILGPLGTTPEVEAKRIYKNK